jgi:hypothetical protein
MKKVKKQRIINGQKTLVPGGRSLESLSHFWCGSCKKWWSVGDAPTKRKEWYCTWCGEKNIFTQIKR